MTTIQLPTLNVKYFSVNTIYLRGDNTSVTKYCQDNGYNLSSFEVEDRPRFSNDGALPYQYWDATKSAWVTEFGFEKIVTSLTYS